jgi:hypothetical protein
MSGLADLTLLFSTADFKEAGDGALAYFPLSLIGF